MTHRIVVAPEAAGGRLDQFLAARDLPFTRSQIKRLIEEGAVKVNGLGAKPARRLLAGDEVTLAPPPPVPTELVPEEIALEILHEDRYLIAVNKPAGLVVHPAAGHASGTLVNALLHHCRDLAGIGGELRPGIVHRLDRDTSGVLVIAKDDGTLAGLAALFKARDLARIYHALVAPPPRREAGTIRTLYGRHPRDRKRFTSRALRGRAAVTHYATVRRFGTLAALVECRLETGRTHQIRVHLAEHGSPVLGDPVYGRRPSDPGLRAIADALGRQALHASTLSLVHPRTGAKLDLSTPLPADMREAIAALEGLADR